VCLLFVCRNAHPDYPLIVLANRDEFHDRPTQRAAFWAEHPSVLAGRDLRAGGTWLGITRHGRWAALTNFREPPRASSDRSRGDLVKDYLTGAQGARDYARTISRAGDEFDGFNLLLGEPHEIIWLSNRGGDVEFLQSGIHGLSNHLLETPWPKVTHGKRKLALQLEQQPVIDRLFQPLVDRTAYPDNLPQTGVDPATERLLSSAFISSASYGTRSSTLIMVNRAGQVYFEERAYDDPAGGPGRPDEYSSSLFQFALASPATESVDPNVGGALDRSPPPHRPGEFKQ